MESKNYTAQELREAAEIMPKSFSCCERYADGSERKLYGDDYSAMLRQAADTEEENIKLKEQNEWYERQPELMGETAREALLLLKAQEAEIAELRECVKQAVENQCEGCSYKDTENGCSDCCCQRWRKALEGMENVK